MSTEIAVLEDLSTYGPAMQALTPKQRAFVEAYMEHPTWIPRQLAELAGYSATSRNSITVYSHRLMKDERILAAMNEEAGKRLKTGGLIGVAAVVKIALNESHKDHLKAALALMNRTGFHELSEHKITVDDKRPQTKREIIEATKNVLAELGMSADEASKFLTKAANEPIEVEFEEVVEPETAEDW